ncbi:MAG: GntR family transcriptional regulator [Candidatus Eisenbacteria bacterium]
MKSQVPRDGGAATLPAPESHAPPPAIAWDRGTVRTLSDRIAEAIREAIIRGDLLPCQPLRQVELSRRLRVSFAPLREAMRQLEAEGFVRFTPFHGAVVAPLEIGELRDYIDILAAVETIAVRAAVPLVTPEVLAEAERAFEELSHEADTARWLGLSLRLRLGLYAPSGRRKLIDLVRMVRLNSHRWARHLYADAEGRQLAIDAARGLIELFRSGDAEGAARHVERTYRAAQSLLEHTAEEVTRRAADAMPSGAPELLLPPAGGRRRPASRRPGARAAARRPPPRVRD